MEEKDIYNIDNDHQYSNFVHFKDILKNPVFKFCLLKDRLDYTSDIDYAQDKVITSHSTA